MLALPLAAALSPAWGGGAPQVVHLPDPQGFSAHGSYFVELVKLALSKSAPGEPAPVLRHVPADIPKERLRQLLQEGQLDLLWSTTTPEREALALPVRFNLLKGTNELRFLLVRAADLPRLQSVRSLEALRRLKAGAGTYWSDAQILRANGFTVETTTKHDALFRMLVAGRFDFISRSREEIDTEVAQYAQQGLVEMPGLALQYRQPVYFFVSRARPELAERLLRGLNMAAADGSFDALFMAQPPLKAQLAQVRAYTGLRLQLRALEASDMAPLKPPR